MGSPITFSGFNSIDFGQILELIMTAERAPMTTLETQKTALNTQGTAYTTLAGKLGALESALDTLTDADGFLPVRGRQRRPGRCRCDGHQWQRGRPLRGRRLGAGALAGHGVNDHVCQPGRSDRHRRQPERCALWQSSGPDSSDRRRRLDDRAAAGRRHQRATELAGDRLGRPGRAGAVPSRADRPQLGDRERVHRHQHAHRRHRRSRSPTPTPTAPTATARRICGRRRPTPRSRSTTSRSTSTTNTSRTPFPASR